MGDCELKEVTDRIKLYYPDGEWRAALWDALVISQCGKFTTSGRGNKRAGVDFTYEIKISNKTGIALKKDWYAVNKKIVATYGAGALVLLISGALVRVYSLNGYQSARLKNWLAHFGIGSYAANADSTINYVNSRLSGTFSKSNLIGGSDAALSAMKEIPAYRSDMILGSVAATCGIVAVAGIIVCLAVLAIYVFNISLRQKNSLGCMIGCSCGVAIGLQSLSNVLIVFGVLPLTDSVLPFFASGLSFTVVDYVLLGLVLSIYRYKDIRREKQAANLTLRRVE